MKCLLLLGVLLPATLLAQTWEIGPRVGFGSPRVVAERANFEVHGFDVYLEEADQVRAVLGLTLRHTPLRARNLTWQLDATHFRGLYTTSYHGQFPNQGVFVSWRNYRAINVPLTLQWQPLGNLRLGVGVGVNLHFYSPIRPVSGNEYDTLRTFSAQLQASYHRVMPFYTFSLGYDIHRFSIDLGWQQSLGSLHRPFTYGGLSYAPERTWGIWMLSAAYRLPLTKPQDVLPTEKALSYERPPAPDYRHTLRLEGGIGLGYQTGALINGEYQRLWQNRWALGVGLHYQHFLDNISQTQTPYRFFHRDWAQIRLIGTEVTGYYKVGDVRRLHGEVGLGTFARMVQWSFQTNPAVQPGVPDQHYMEWEPEIGATLSLGVASGLPSYGRAWQDRVSTSLRYTFQYGTYAEPLHGVRLGVGYHF